MTECQSDDEPSPIIAYGADLSKLNAPNQVPKYDEDSQRADNHNNNDCDSDTSQSSLNSANDDGYLSALSQKKNALVHMIRTNPYSPMVINQEIMNNLEDLEAPPCDKKSFIWGCFLMFLAAYLFSISTAIVKWNHQFGRESFELFVFRMVIQLCVTSMVASISVVMNHNYCYEQLSTLSASEWDEGDTGTETDWDESDAELGQLAPPNLGTPRKVVRPKKMKAPAGYQYGPHHRRRRGLSLRTLSSVLCGMYKCPATCCPIRFVCTDVFATFWRESSKQTKWYILARGICGGTGSVCYFWAVDLLPIDDCIMMFSLFPIFSTLFSALILKERVSYWHLLALGIATTGIVLMTYPSFIFGRDDRDDRVYNIWDTEAILLVQGYGYAFIGSVCYGLVYVFIRMAYKAPTFALIFSNGLCGLFEAILICTLFSRFLAIPHWDSWLVAIGIACIGYLGQNAENRSGKCILASLASLIRVTEVFWGYVWQNLLYAQPAGLVASLGAGMLAVAILVMMVDKYRYIKEIEIGQALEGIMDYSTECEQNDSDEQQPQDLAAKPKNKKSKAFISKSVAKISRQLCGALEYEIVENMDDGYGI